MEKNKLLYPIACLKYFAVGRYESTLFLTSLL